MSVLPTGSRGSMVDAIALGGALLILVVGCGPKAAPPSPEAFLKVLYTSQSYTYDESEGKQKAKDGMTAQTGIGFEWSEPGEIPPPPAPSQLFNRDDCDSFVPKELQALSNSTCGYDIMQEEYLARYRLTLAASKRSERLVLYVTPIYLITAQPGYVTGSTVQDLSATPAYFPEKEASYIFDNAINEVISHVDPPGLQPGTKRTYIYLDLIHELGHQVPHLTHAYYGIDGYPSNFDTNFRHNLSDSTSGRCVMKTPLTYQDALSGKLHYCNSSPSDPNNSCRARWRAVVNLPP